MTTKLAIFAYDGCLSTSITGPTDVFHIANIHQRVRKEDPGNPLFSWKIYSPDGKPVNTSTGITIAVDGRYEEAGNPDICLIPGCFSKLIFTFLYQFCSAGINQARAHF